MFNGYVAKSLQTTVSDTRHQVVFLRSGLEKHIGTKQTLEDVATDIFALLFVVEQGARHPLHLDVVLHEQPLDSLLFHHALLIIPFKGRKN